MRRLKADLSEGTAPDVAGLKTARNVVRAARRLEAVACAFGVRSLERVAPGISAGVAALDTTLAERAVADLAALGSAVSAKSRTAIGPVAGIVSAGLGLWRDALSDDRRAVDARKD